MYTVVIRIEGAAYTTNLEFEDLQEAVTYCNHKLSDKDFAGPWKKSGEMSLERYVRTFSATYSQMIFGQSSAR